MPGNLYVPVNLLKPILGDLLADGPSQRPVAALARRVDRAGPGQPDRLPRDPRRADLAGLSAGDIIVGVGPEKIGSHTSSNVWRLGPEASRCRCGC